MEQLVKRVSYLRGLADGLEPSQGTKESRILAEMIELLDDMCGEMRALHARLEETEEYVEAVDEDLADLEMMLYEDDDLYEQVEDGEDHTPGAGESRRDLDEEEAEEPEYEVTYEFSCPSCQEGIALREGMDKDGFLHYVIEPAREQEEAVNPT